MVSGNLSGHLDKIGNIATKIELEALLGTARICSESLGGLRISSQHDDQAERHEQ